MDRWPPWGPLLCGYSFEGEPVLFEDLTWAACEVREWLQLKLTSGVVSKELISQLALSYCRLPCLPRRPQVLVDMHEVLDQIGVLESARECRPIPTKPESQWRSGPLRGLWHKHWTQATFMGHNLIREFDAMGLKYVMERLRPTYGELLRTGIPLDGDAIDLIARAAIVDTYHGRMMRGVSHDTSRKKKEDGLTGEWIVYARTGFTSSRNVYLTLATHNEPKPAILARCRTAINEFPELLDIDAFAS